MALERLEITAREAFAGGRTFGESGAYERIDGLAHFALDPELPANRRIVDLELAPRDAGGRVRFDADFTILRPLDGGARRLLVDIPNRGSKPANTFLNQAPRPLVPVVEIDPGDGFLFERGWTVAWVGWQWDVPAHPALCGLRAPEAMVAGGPLLGRTRLEIVCAERRAFAGLRDETLGPSINTPLTAADVDDAGATLEVQDFPDGPQTLLPRDSWRFARVDEAGTVTPDDRYVWLDGGFDPGRIYTVTYTTNRSPIVGAGLAATRDFTSFLRYERDGARNPLADRIDYAYGFGVSQSGRFLRTMLYEGMNTDETGRAVFDGMHIHIGGGRRGDFNVRHGLPAVEGTYGLGHLPPFADEPADGFPGLLDRQRQSGGVPLVIATNTAAEYWRGDGGLVHTSITGADLPLPPEVRVYAFAGAAHSHGLLPFVDGNPLNGDRGRHLYNVLDYRPLARAALVNLDRWASGGVEPPPSAYPRAADGTSAGHAEVLAAFERVPGAHVPAAEGLRIARALDFGPDAERGIARHPVAPGEPYATRVSAVDGDGNETAGIRLPDVAVPMATYAGWNPRHPDTGGEGQLLRLAGSTLLFARTEAERAARGDPRPSLDARYAGREDYAAKLAAHADSLVAQRYALERDRERMVAEALARWDAADVLREGANRPLDPP